MVKLTVSSLLATALFFLSAPVRAQTAFSLEYTYFDSPTGGGSTGEFLLFVPGTYGYEMTIGFEFNGVDYTEYQVSAVLDGTTVTATCPSIVALSTLALIPNEDASAYTLTWVNGTVALPEGTLTNAFELVNGQLEAIVPSVRPILIRIPLESSLIVFVLVDSDWCMGFTWRYCKLLSCF